jgi:hypothetical protein
MVSLQAILPLEHLREQVLTPAETVVMVAAVVQHRVDLAQVDQPVQAREREPVVVVVVVA